MSPPSLKKGEKMEKLKEALKLPALHGSEKQIKWGEEIRDKFIAAFARRGMKAEMILQIRDNIEASPNADVKRDIERLYTQDSAKWILWRSGSLFGEYAE
jgi:hypothetical protein